MQGDATPLFIFGGIALVVVAVSAAFSLPTWLAIRGVEAEARLLEAEAVLKREQKDAIHAQT